MQTSTTTHSIVLEGTLTKPVIGDTLRLSQVVSNILSNAVKYSPPGSMVRVDMKEEKDNAIVSIADSGIGIDKSHHTRIFDRFYRVDEKGSVFAGLGIGLYLSSEIIKRHGGKIWVESEIGKGATFCISLPTHKEPT
jgi:signal transduction histidine kinase